ncbi:flagellin-like protein [Halogeometricum sp. S1BR25-6]|uniref:Flagellin-like protein n=1 Tax=Halogeometricum salsisoli TaxID=2950536 RepID=A0ABU2GAQ8_9EURY|nr:flagellin-like protein [Halogeometricum sp. S1BR25-6]MDS0297903.1 flagellin-like protein [Halogeometricum sp. S1BR25-6]
MTRSRGNGDRAQSAVVGVAVLLGITVVGIGVLTAAAGAVVEEGATAAATARVADGIDDALDTGTVTETETTVRLADGTLRTADRTVRVLGDSGVVWSVNAGAVVYESRGRRVSAVAGAVTSGPGGRSGGSSMSAPPSVAAADGTLYVGVPALNASGTDAVSARGAALPVTLRTAPTHERRILPADRYRVAVETTAPAAWEREFRRRGTTTVRRDFDGDGVPSVVAAFPGERTVHLVVHDLRLEMEVGA